MRTIKNLILVAIIGCFAFGHIFAQGGAFSNTVVALNGVVYNEVTKKPVKISIDVFDENGKKFTTTKSLPADGSYYITGLKPGKRYTFRIHSELGVGEQYMKETFDFTFPESKNYTEFSKDFLAKPLVKESRMKIAVSPFYSGKGALRTGAEVFLENMKNALSENKAIKFVIASYPDNGADKAANTKLTEERANSLKAYFEKNGIDASRISLASNEDVDALNPPPTGKSAKGKKYIGPSFIIIKEFK